MRKGKNGIVFLGTIMMILTISCEKPVGIGGESTISGKVFVHSYDKEFTVLQEIYPAGDEDVYIIYGDNNVFSDDMETSHNGMFEFKNLTKGKYTIFAYSDDTTKGSLSDMVVDTVVELSSNKSKLEIESLIIYKLLDYDDGHATIKGTLKQVNWSKDFIYIMDTTNAQDTRVFLVNETNNQYIDDVRTLDDGSFIFPDLLKGDYKIYALADDVHEGLEKISRAKTIKIGEIDEKVDIGNIYIEIED